MLVLGHYLFQETNTVSREKNEGEYCYCFSKTLQDSNTEPTILSIFFVHSFF